jgi:hypothetical protein
MLHAYGLIIFLLLMVAAAVLIWAMLTRVDPVAGQRSHSPLGEIRCQFGRWRVSDIQRSVIAQVERNATSTLRRCYLWNEIAIHLDPATFESFAPLGPEVQAETESLLGRLTDGDRRNAAGLPYVLLTPPSARLVRDPDVPRGTVVVRGSFRRLREVSSDVTTLVREA